VACGSRPRPRIGTGRPRPSWRRYAITGSTLDGYSTVPSTGESFRTYVEKVLLPTLRPGDIVIMDNLGNHKAKAVRQLIRAAGDKYAKFDIFAVEGMPK
jgi:hypothetical protein